MNYETKLQIQAALVKRGWKYAAIVINDFVEALESTDEQKALRTDAERLNKLQEIFIKGDDVHIVMCTGENNDELCEHDTHPHFEAFDWSWRSDPVRSNTLRGVVDQAIDKARGG
jgi:asparagine synthetase A